MTVGVTARYALECASEHTEHALRRDRWGRWSCIGAVSWSLSVLPWLALYHERSRLHQPKTPRTETAPMRAWTRKCTVEPTFGIIKSVLGFRQFLLRGLRSVQHEWTLVCIGWNLKRLHRLQLAS